MFVRRRRSITPLTRRSRSRSVIRSGVKSPIFASAISPSEGGFDSEDAKKSEDGRGRTRLDSYPQKRGERAVKNIWIHITAATDGKRETKGGLSYEK